MKKYLIYVALVAITTAYIPSMVSATQTTPRKHGIQNVYKKVVQATVATIEATATAPKLPDNVSSIPTDHVSLMKAAGIAPADYYYVNYIVSHESGWCSTKWEGEIGYCANSSVALYRWDYPYKGYGECQSTPAIKMSAVKTDWQTNPVTQLQWCDQYAKSSRYGSWYVAYQHWLISHNW